MEILSLVKSMKIQMIGIGLALLLLASCGTLVDQEKQSLAEEQRREKEELQQKALQSVDSPLSDAWNAVAPGVWSRITEHANGGISVGTRAQGLEALVWLGETEWKPRLSAIDAELATATLTTARRAQLQFQKTQLENRLAVIERWQQIEDNLADRGHDFTTMPCTASARASAMPTTSSTGAKAYASARTCTQGRTGYARAAAEPPYKVNESWAQPGDTASASEAAYGTDCSSAGYADGYPEYADEWYHC